MFPNSLLGGITTGILRMKELNTWGITFTFQLRYEYCYLRELIEVIMLSADLFLLTFKIIFTDRSSHPSQTSQNGNSTSPSPSTQRRRQSLRRQKRIQTWRWWRRQEDRGWSWWCPSRIRKLLIVVNSHFPEFPDMETCHLMMIYWNNLHFFLNYSVVDLDVDVVHPHHLSKLSLYINIFYKTVQMEQFVFPLRWWNKYLLDVQIFVNIWLHFLTIYYNFSFCWNTLRVTLRFDEAVVIWHLAEYFHVHDGRFQKLERPKFRPSICHHKRKK